MPGLDRSVEVFYPLESLWYWGQVLDGPDASGEYFVRYEQWGDEYDEWVRPERIRPRRIPGEGIAGQPGEPVEASTYQGWVPATIVEGPDVSGRYRLNMDGWDASYDQWLPLDKLRLRWTEANSTWSPADPIPAPNREPALHREPAPFDPVTQAGNRAFIGAGSTYAAYALVTPAGGAAPHWVECGTVTEQEDGRGLEVRLDLLPVSGRLVIRTG